MDFGTEALLYGILFCLILVPVLLKDKFRDYKENKKIKEIKNQELEMFKKESQDLIKQFESQYLAYEKDIQKHKKEFCEQKCSHIIWDSNTGIALSRDNNNLVIFSVINPRKHIFYESKLEIDPPKPGEINIKADIPVDKILFFDNKESITVYKKTVYNDKMKAAVTGAVLFGTAGAIVGSQVKEKEEIEIENKNKETILMIRDGNREYNYRYPQGYYLHFEQLIPQKSYALYRLNELKKTALSPDNS